MDYLPRYSLSLGIFNIFKLDLHGKIYRVRFVEYDTEATF